MGLGRGCHFVCAAGTPGERSLIDGVRQRGTSRCVDTWRCGGRSPARSRHPHSPFPHVLTAIPCTIPFPCASTPPSLPPLLAVATRLSRASPASPQSSPKHASTHARSDPARPCTTRARQGMWQPASSCVSSRRERRRRTCRCVVGVCVRACACVSAGCACARVFVCVRVRVRSCVRVRVYACLCCAPCVSAFVHAHVPPCVCTCVSRVRVYARPQQVQSSSTVGGATVSMGCHTPLLELLSEFQPCLSRTHSPAHVLLLDPPHHSAHPHSSTLAPTHPHTAPHTTNNHTHTRTHTQQQQNHTHTHAHTPHRTLRTLIPVSLHFQHTCVFALSRDAHTLGSILVFSRAFP